MTDIASLRAKADAGDAESQQWLGGLYYDGRGVPKDYAEAYFWFLLADAAGYDIARAQADKAAAKLRNTERAYAEKLAAKWKPTPPPTTQAPIKTAEPPEVVTRHSKLAKAAVIAWIIVFFSVIIFFLLFGDDKASRAAMALLISILTP